jgi:hypothetical protein
MTTIERLSEEYREADLHPRDLELVSDEETFIFFNEHHWLWPIVFWIVFIAAIILPGVIEK